MGNAHLTKAFLKKDDEFYTPVYCVHRELVRYRGEFAGKSIVCPCNDAMRNFWIYLHKNFARYGLRRLVAMRYARDGGPGYALIYEGGDDRDVTAARFVILCEGGGFETEEVRQYIADADIVVTNPPFSLAYKFACMLFDLRAKFLFICVNTLFKRGEVFCKICAGEAWSGFDYDSKVFFAVPCGDAKKISICWLTNLVTAKHCQKFEFKAKHIPGGAHEYFDNMPEILNVNAMKDIPCDYPGIMGVPITILRYCQSGQFEVIDKCAERLFFDSLGINEYLRKNKLCANAVKGKKLFERILIKLKL